ncbi:hypothetical protein [Roseivirga echinicomitans]|uniref:Uncharacterized protein n=1 Tax=Roseivirga echinicomitans TaxID=296218 RepID=A0A150X373_9BACT|nr:hypothetical protein [Roseivirga echinicomitans]KYG73166.1 hypothetical protein AWN68_10800 [Roseivirga echinicomitans]
MVSRISFVLCSVLISIVLLSAQLPNDHQLKHAPKLTVTELDFGTEAVTFCMHEGVKVRFKLALDDFETEDVKVKKSKGEVDLKTWEAETFTYLINPKAEAFEVEVWVKMKDVDQIHVPVIDGKVAAYDASGAYNTTNAKWRSVKEMYEVEGDYVKVISNWKLFGRICE